MNQAGQSVGIDFTGKCDVRPDTVPSHAALHYIQAEERAGRAPPGSQDRLQEELFADYFTNGVHLDAKGIGGAASRVGLDADAVSRAAADPSSHATVQHSWTFSTGSQVLNALAHVTSSPCIRPSLFPT